MMMPWCSRAGAARPARHHPHACIIIMHPYEVQKKRENYIRLMFHFFSDAHLCM
jgi:hypothetical protein